MGTLAFSARRLVSWLITHMCQAWHGPIGASCVIYGWGIWDYRGLRSWLYDGFRTIYI